MTQIIFDASDYRRVAAIYAAMPADLQKIAFRRAAARAQARVEGDYARFASRVLKVAQKHIRKRMRSNLTGADILLVVRSSNIPLDEIGARQGRRGVSVAGRGMYDGAFIPPRGAARAAGYVLKREGAGRTPTHRLFGPSPANAVNRKPADYEDLLAEIAATVFAATILQQAAFLLGRG